VLSLIRRLCEADGPPGREAAVIDLIRAHLTEAGVRVSAAPMGGLTAGADPGGAARLMLAAAVDEPGLLLSEPVENGVARAYRLGALPASAYAGGRIRTLRGQSATVLPLDEGAGAGRLRWELKADLGSASAQLPQADGAFAVLDEPFSCDGTRLAGKALQDRAACAVLAHLAGEGKAQVQGCTFAFFCQGQLGLYGLRLALRALAPNAVILVRGLRHAARVDPQGSALLAGAGPVLVLRHGHSLSHSSLVAACESAASETGIALQRAVLGSTRPRSAAAEAVLSGIPLLEIGFAVIDADSSRQGVEMGDLEQLVSLISTLAARLA